MRKEFLFIRSNMRKSKGQTVAIAVLVLIAAVMFDLWLMLATDYRANLDRYIDDLNDGHVIFAVADDSDEMYAFLDSTIDGDERTSEYSIDGALFAPGQIPYNSGFTNTNFIFLKKDVALTRSVGKVEMIKDSGADGLYLPMLYETGDVKIGNEIILTVAGVDFAFNVAGFFNSPMAGSHNCGLSYALLTDGEYAEFEKAQKDFSAYTCAVRLKNKSASAKYEADLAGKVASFDPAAFQSGNSYDMVQTSRYISQSITASVIAVMAFIVLLITVIVLVSNVINYIGANLKSIGALKAMGYTSGQLITAIMMQFVGLVFIISLLGIGLSYAIFPAINSMMILQTGIPYAIRFLPIPSLITVAILCASVALAVLFAARRINKIEPIVALRNGTATHSFKRNHIPLDKARTPLDFSLALKSTFGSIKNNVIVFVTVFVLSLVIVVSAVLIRNMIADSEPFITLIVGETADACVNVDIDTEDTLTSTLADDDRVEKYYLYLTENVRCAIGDELIVNICDDFDKVSCKTVVYEGRFPEYDNEVAIAGKYAKATDLKIGGEVRLSANGGEIAYLITGFTQVTNNLGKDCLLTRAGYERMGELTNVSYYIDLIGDADIDEFLTDVSSAMDVNAAINAKKTIDASVEVYVSLMAIIVIAILIVSVVIIAFVLYLLVRTLLQNKNRDYGVLKSLGFTTGRLVLQTALSFMPMVLIAAVLGLVVSSFAINPLLSVFMGGIGIVKCTFIVPIGLIVGLGAGFIAIAFATACLLSLRVKNITPRALLAGE